LLTSSPPRARTHPPAHLTTTALPRLRTELVFQICLRTSPFSIDRAKVHVGLCFSCGEMCDPLFPTDFFLANIEQHITPASSLRPRPPPPPAPPTALLPPAVEAAPLSPRCSPLHRLRHRLLLLCRHRHGESEIPTKLQSGLQWSRGPHSARDGARASFSVFIFELGLDFFVLLRPL
jgi:hypothetical protein